jgi:hypothetical protein
VSCGSSRCRRFRHGVSVSSSQILESERALTILRFSDLSSTLEFSSWLVVVPDRVKEAVRLRQATKGRHRVDTPTGLEPTPTVATTLLVAILMTLTVFELESAT